MSIIGEGALFDRDCQIGSPSPIFLNESRWWGNEMKYVRGLIPGGGRGLGVPVGRLVGVKTGGEAFEGRAKRGEGNGGVPNSSVVAPGRKINGLTCRVFEINMVAGVIKAVADVLAEFNFNGTGVFVPVLP